MEEMTGLGKKKESLKKERRNSYGNVEEMMRQKRDRQEGKREGGRKRHLGGARRHRGHQVKRRREE